MMFRRFMMSWFCIFLVHACRWITGFTNVETSVGHQSRMQEAHRPHREPHQRRASIQVPRHHAQQAEDHCQPCRVSMFPNFQPALRQVQCSQQHIVTRYGPHLGEPTPCWSGASQRDGLINLPLNVTDLKCPRHTGPATLGRGAVPPRSQTLSKGREQMTHCPLPRHRRREPQATALRCQEQRLQMQSLLARVEPSHKASYDRFALCHLGSSSAKPPSFWPSAIPWRVKPRNHLGAVLGPITERHDSVGSLSCRGCAIKMQLRPQNMFSHCSPVALDNSSSCKSFLTDLMFTLRSQADMHRTGASLQTCPRILNTRLISQFSPEVSLSSKSQLTWIECWPAPHQSSEIGHCDHSRPCTPCQRCNQATYSACSARAKGAMQPAAKSQRTNPRAHYRPDGARRRTAGELRQRRERAERAAARARASEPAREPSSAPT